MEKVIVLAKRFLKLKLLECTLALALVQHRSHNYKGKS